MSERTYSLPKADRNRWQMRATRAAESAFEETQAKMRSAIRDSPSGQYAPGDLWNDEWWVVSADKHLAPVLWSIRWEAAEKAAAGLGLEGSLVWIPFMSYQRGQFIAQMEAIYGYAETVGARVAELATKANADQATKGWLMEQLGLVAAAGPLSPGIAKGMGLTESVTAAESGSAALIDGGTPDPAVRKWKKWQAIFHHTRQSHAQAHGQRRLEKNPYSIGGYKGMYPGDPLFPAAERVNCQCFQLFSVTTPTPKKEPKSKAKVRDGKIKAKAGGDKIRATENVDGRVRKTASKRDVQRRYRESGYDQDAAHPRHNDLLPANHKLNKVTKTVHDEIDRLHAMPGDLDEIPVVSGVSSKGARGEFVRYGSGQGRPMNIGLKASGDTPHMTYAHELGHYFDFEDFGAKGRFSTNIKGSQYGRATPIDELAAGEYDEIMQPFFDAVLDSPEWRQMRGMVDLPAGETWEVLIDGTDTYRLRPDRTHLRYLMSPHEVWARAYAQFVAVESGNTAMLAELAAAQSSALYPYQWSDEAFEPIRRAMREIFRKADLAE